MVDTPEEGDGMRTYLSAMERDLESGIGKMVGTPEEGDTSDIIGLKGVHG